MAAQSGFLVRWLRGAWLAWLLLFALVAGMQQVALPRTGQFLDFWYSVPADTRNQADVLALRQQREQQITRYLWLAVAAPVTALLLLQLAFTLNGRRDEDDVDEQVDAGIAYTAPAPAPAPAQADMTLVRPAVGAAANATDATLQRPALSIALPADNGGLLIGGGRYRAERLLASGGMGSVHKGFDLKLQREVAIKELDVNLAQDPEQADRFRQEALALASLAHPYIVPVYDLVEEDNRFWIVMELLSGGDLDQRIEKNPPNVKTATNIIRAIAEGLAFAHNKGIVHRDIKPMNILFNSDGIPKLVDFGIAKLVQSSQSVVHTRDGLSLGSPTYMSPEQAQGKRDIDRRADIYALGITFFKLLTRVVPFTGDVGEVMAQHITQAPPSPRELNPAVSEELEAIVLKMLAKKPEGRYQRLEDFIAALDALKKT